METRADFLKRIEAVEAAVRELAANRTPHRAPSRRGTASASITKLIAAIEADGSRELETAADLARATGLPGSTVSSLLRDASPNQTAPARRLRKLWRHHRDGGRDASKIATGVIG